MKRLFETISFQIILFLPHQLISHELCNEDERFVETVVMIDPDTRYDIFVVCSRYMKLAESNKIQNRAKESSQNSILTMPRHLHEIVYNGLAQPWFLGMLRDRKGLAKARVAEIFQGNLRVNAEQAHNFIQRNPSDNFNANDSLRGSIIIGVVASASRPSASTASHSAPSSRGR